MFTVAICVPSPLPEQIGFRVVVLVPAWYVVRLAGGFTTIPYRHPAPELLIAPRPKLPPVPVHKLPMIPPPPKKSNSPCVSLRFPSIGNGQIDCRLMLKGAP